MEAETDEVVLIDEAGQECRFRLHDAFDLDDVTYFLVESAEDPEQVLLLRQGAGTLETVEGLEFERVLAMLEAEE